MKTIIYQKKEEVNNRNRFFKFISTTKTFKKQDVATALKLSFPTASKFTDEFLTLGIIKKGELENGAGKKKALAFSYNPNSYFSVGIKLEVNRISFIIINLNGEILKKNEIQKDFFDKKGITEYIFFQLNLFLKDFKDVDKIKGLGISLPGIVNNKSKIFEIGTNFKIFSESFQELEERTGFPVYLVNEANAGAIGEYILGNFKTNNLAFISIDTGIGCGIIINGNLYLGNNFKAGEFGHFSVEINGKQCTCGNRGCLERYCSITALVKEFELVFNRKNLDLFDIFSESLHETDEGKNILNNYFNYLGNSIRSLQLLFDFDKIIIGGQITNFHQQINLKKSLEDIIFNNIFLNYKNLIEISKQSDTSNILGAAFLPFKEFYSDIFENLFE